MTNIEKEQVKKEIEEAIAVVDDLKKRLRYDGIIGKYFENIDTLSGTRICCIHLAGHLRGIILCCE